MRRSLVLVVAVLVAMSVGRVLTDSVPLAQVATKPFVRTGTVGHPLTLRYADLEASDVRSAAFLDDGTSAIAPAGRFLVVDATVTARRAPRLIQYTALLGGDGRTYAPTRRGGCSASPTAGYTAPTGVPYHVMLCFDVPREALRASRLEVSLGDPGFDAGQSRDDLAHIDLGIGADQAAQLWATRTGYDGFGGGFDRPSLERLTPSTSGATPGETS